jgi:hypothetical protein
VGVISRLYNFVVGTTIDSEQVDAEFNQILAVLNGSIDPANLSAASKNTFLKLASAADKKEAFGFYDNAARSGGWGADTTSRARSRTGWAPPRHRFIAGAPPATTGGAGPRPWCQRDTRTSTTVKLIARGRRQLNFPGVGIYWRAIA